MTMTRILDPQRDLDELRQAFLDADSFDHDGVLHIRTIEVLDMVVSYLVPFTLVDPFIPGGDERKAFLLRCMGAMAHAKAEAAYEPHGYVNPFAFPAFEGLASVPVPPAWPPARLEVQWPWPVVANPPRSGAAAGFAGASLREYSALKMFGYTVGKTDGWPLNKRQAFLRDFMTMPLPPVVKATFGDEYGAPMTATRLRKIANVIATNATNFYRNDPKRYAVAIANWEDDLEFLYREFYIGKRLAFDPWPSTRPA